MIPSCSRIAIAVLPVVLALIGGHRGRLIAAAINPKPFHLKKDFGVTKSGEPIGMRNFRRSDGRVATPGDRIDATGLEQIDISGSSEFTSKDLLSGPLATLIEQKGPGRVIVVDLRQEPHGYLGTGEPVSWRTDDGKVPFIIPVATVMDSEVHLLSQVPFGLSERRLVESRGIGYARFSLTDRCAPDEASINDFIRFVQGPARGKWLHFHCAAGHGRTTTFMAMTDMLRSARGKADAASAEQILHRQAALTKAQDVGAPGTKPFDLSTKPTDPRHALLVAFHEYCRRCRSSQSGFAHPFSLRSRSRALADADPDEED